MVKEFKNEYLYLFWLDFQKKNIKFIDIFCLNMKLILNFI